MNKYIDVVKFRNKLDENLNCCTSKVNIYGTLIAKNILDDFPLEDVQPVVHAHWRRYGYFSCQCSNCNIPQSSTSRYCPCCGAKMDGDEHE